MTQSTKFGHLAPPEPGELDERAIRAANVKPDRAQPEARATYLVWSPEGATEPRVTYPNHQAAFHAAHVMAERHPGQRFCVVKQCSRFIIHAPDADEGEEG